MDDQHENIMPLAPLHRGITNVLLCANIEANKSYSSRNKRFNKICKTKLFYCTDDQVCEYYYGSMISCMQSINFKSNLLSDLFKKTHPD